MLWFSLFFFWAICTTNFSEDDIEDVKRSLDRSLPRLRLISTVQKQRVDGTQPFVLRLSFKAMTAKRAEKVTPGLQFSDKARPGTVHPRLSPRPKQAGFN
ncbi:hypothetical protein CIHG_07813 [Coccidioides immitis H538.4]|uniref:Uncharacterized protein n=2 Tax=Coccidioides immitis TaxID=5501 RepID=A0A0J8UQF5_COCIT|nr:hypothetical protein CIRG_05637 [Coccidioides immitis RMSCC 2394]KMU89778.1 hypothetical protein CIHG_07813 [Coccidioides immitis H538.4]